MKKKKWFYIKDKVPDNEKVGTFFEIDYKGVYYPICDYFYVALSDVYGKVLLNVTGQVEEYILLSEWKKQYDKQGESHCCDSSKWRYVIDQSELNMIRLLDL